MIFAAPWSDDARPERSGSAREQGDVGRERGRAEDETSQSAPSLQQPLELLKGIFGR